MTILMYGRICITDCKDQVEDTRLDTNVIFSNFILKVKLQKTQNHLTLCDRFPSMATIKPTPQASRSRAGS